MAKINAHGLRQLGPTLFTERDHKSMGDWDQDAVVHEAFRVRSDGMVQRRMIRSVNADGTTVEHRGSAYTNLGKLRVTPTTGAEAELALQRFLIPRRTIVKAK